MTQQPDHLSLADIARRLDQMETFIKELVAVMDRWVTVDMKHFDDDLGLIRSEMRAIEKQRLLEERRSGCVLFPSGQNKINLCQN